MASVLPSVLLLAVVEPWYDAGWKPISWELSRLAANLYGFGLLGLLHATLFGLPMLLFLKRLNGWTLMRSTAGGALAAAGPWLLFFLAGIRSDFDMSYVRVAGSIIAVPLMAGGLSGFVFFLLVMKIDQDPNT